MSLDKAFRWRHLLAKAFEHQPNKASGLLAVDETYFGRSKRGCRLTGRDQRKGSGGRLGSHGGGIKHAAIPVLLLALAASALSTIEPFPR